MSTTRQLCTFSLGDLFLGVDVTGVQEVLRYQQMTAVPLTSAVVKGIINLRGQIFTAIDARARFGLPPRADETQSINVVIKTVDGVVSLLVDEIGDVVEVDPSTFERLPETVQGLVREHVHGVYKLERLLLLLLDTERVAALSGVEQGRRAPEPS